MSAYPQLADPTEYRRLLAQYGSKRAVARALGCAKSTVDEWGQRHGIEFVPSKPEREVGQLDALLAALKEPSTIDELANAVDRSPATVEKWLNQLQDDGYNILEVGGRYCLPRFAAPAEAAVDHRRDSTRRTIAVVSDTHLGSKYQQLTHLRRFYRICADRGIDTVYHVGDIIDGEGLYRGHEYNVFRRGFDEQIEYAVAKYPQEDGIKTELIGGNHDLVYIKRAGADPCVRIAAERSDIRYHGPYSAWVRLTNGATMYLLHPDGGGAYALSYKLQKIIESFEGGRKPHILFAGHWHQRCYVFNRNVHGFLAACFQAQTEFERRKALQPSIGGTILTLEFDDDGAIHRVTPEFVNFLEPIEGDW